MPQGWTWAGGGVAPTVRAAQKLPVTVTDGTGTRTTIRDTSKIIVGGDDVADVLAGMGLSRLIYAAPAESVAPAAVRAPKHYEYSQNTGVEGLLSVAGTLFIGNNTARHSDVAKKFRAAGVGAVVLDDQASIPDKIRALGSYVGSAGAGDQLAGAVGKQVSAAATAARKASMGATKVLVVTASGAGGADAVVGTGTAAAEITKALGVTNVGVAAGLRQYSVKYSDEGLLAAAPDVVITGTADMKKWKSLAGFLKAFPTLAQTPAGQKNGFVLMPSEQIKVSGTSVGAAALALAKALPGVVKEK